MKKEAETTVRRIVLGESTLVTCGAGMQVERVLCGFECCYISINNLPQDIKRPEIEELFTSQDVALFYVVKLRTWGDKVEAKVFVDADAGETFADNLDGTELRGKTLDIAVDDDAGPNKMGSSARTDVNVLSVSWRQPARTFLVQCDDSSDARKIISKLHNTIYCGRRIRAELHQSYFFGDTDSVKVSGVPPGVSFKLPEGISTDLSDHCYITDSATSTDNFDSKAVERDLRRTVEAMAGYQTYELSPADSNKVNVEVRIRFTSWDNTKRAHDRLLQPLRPGYPKFFLRLPRKKQIEYSIRIPLAQYRAQTARWDSFRERDGRRAAFVNVTDNNTDRVLIRVLGDDKKEVGKLRVRVENLIAGEALDASFWHRSFMGGRGQRILEDISTRTDAYIRCDWKTKSLKVYADGRAKEDALELLKERVDGLNESEFSVAIGRGSVGFFMRKGLAALKNELGDDAATLEPIPTPRLIIRGGEEAHRIVDRLLEESRTGFQLHAKNGEDACPVCFDEPSSPVLLGCKHTYCSECISHFLMSASDRKQFPLVCAGDNDNCGVPISIPLIQRFLSPQQFDQLLEAAVASYIEKQPERFQYCTTADCKQVYRRGMGAHTCPSCFANICTACSKEAHEGMTCEEREVLDNPAEQERRNDEWALSAGAKRCPTCRILVQKTEGCNHMECPCGTHFCWICLQVSDRATIYEHMRNVHGGIDTPDVPRRIQVTEPVHVNREGRLRTWRDIAEANRLQGMRAQLAGTGAGPARANANERADYEYALRLQREENLRAGLGVDAGVGLQYQQLLQANRQEDRVQEILAQVEETRRRRTDDAARRVEEARRRAEEARRRAEEAGRRAEQQLRAQEERGSWCVIM
jgi:hypothetical protein